MKVLIIDQFNIRREGMKAILQEMDKECDFLEVDTIEEGVAIADGLDLDLITIDLDVSEISRTGILNKIENSNLRGNIILFSRLEDYSIMHRAYEMGISAFVGKQTKKEITISVFQLVLAGGKYFSPEVIGGSQIYENQGPMSRFLISPESQSILSDRQTDVLKLLSEGKPNKIIAHELNIAVGTVKVHVARIFKSLKATNRTHAVGIASHINIL